MTSRPTTLVESDQLAQAAAQVIRHEDFLPKGKRWPFQRVSKAQRDYERQVQEITSRRREARQQAIEQQIKKQRGEADTVFERAKSAAQRAHDEKIAEAKKPYDVTEAKARSERDAAIAAANLAYQQTMEGANATYRQEAEKIDRVCEEQIGDAKTIHNEAYSRIDAKRRADLAQIAKDLKTIPLEGPMRIVEDRQAWSVEERQKALIAILEMAGRDDFDSDYADLCLRNVAGYVYQDRYLKPEEQHHRLMSVGLVEGLVDLAMRTPDKRPTIVRHLHDIVVQNPGHSSPSFIKNLTELYVAASTDTLTTYHLDPVENENVFEAMRAQIADTLKLTPRRSQVSSPPTQRTVTKPVAASDASDDHATPVMVRSAEITADVDIGDLVPVEGEPQPPRPRSD